MGILYWLLFGLIAGVLAKWVVPGTAPAGLLGDIIAGILGGLAGGWVFTLFARSGVAAFNLAAVACAVIGAVVVLNALRLVAGRSRPTA